MKIHRTDEAWRRECEARDVLKRMDLEQRREYLQGVEKRRGKAACEELKAEIERQFYKQRKGRK